MTAAPTDAELRRYLGDARVIAVLGAHDEDDRAACYVPAYLHAHGYRILPVNPRLVGKTLWGEPVRARLGELGEPIDLVDVFRRSSALAGHQAELLALVPSPKVVWFQQGVRDDAVAAALAAHGIAVVQDRCTLADHRRLGL